MRRRRSSIAVLCLAAGCAPVRPDPVLAPQPVAPPPLAQSATPASAADTARRDTVDVPAVVSDSEVVTRAAAIFDGVPAAPVRVSDVIPVGPAAPGDARATWDIDVRSYETHQAVAQYVGVFTGRAREYMQRSISRGTRYDAFLRKKFRESGLPEDMTYLALIESSYLPNAYSRAAAVGMWQFMAPTARSVGMRVDWWVDERRDPMRATEGAVDFLTDLHRAYGSWYLAAAAYNGGPGRVSRGLRRFSDEMDGAEGEDRFFALAEQKYLPSETKAYVPKLIAAAMVAKEPLRYGLRVDTLPAFEYDSVEVPAGTALAAVGQAAGATVDEMKDLNPHFLRGVTPPGEVSEVRIPLGSAERFREGYGRMSAGDRAGWHELRVSTARSAQSIADEAGVPLKSLFWVNPNLSLARRGMVRAGTLLRVPTSLAVAGARDVPNPSIARMGGSSRPAEVLVSQRVRVRRGESLTSVARRSGVSVAQLRALNGIKGNRLRAGQVLVVKRPSKRALDAARRSAAARARTSERAGQRCTTRMVRVKGKRRAVRSCVAVPRPSASTSKRAGSARAASPGAGSKKASASRRGRARAAAPARSRSSAQRRSNGRSSSPARRPASKAKPKPASRRR